MRFTETELSGAFVIEGEPIGDERGQFVRIFCSQEFKGHGLNGDVTQCSVSVNRVRGTLRGMHFQLAPHAECKLVRCLRGAIYDVIVDLRPDSPTYARWTAVELAQGSDRLVYVPEGMAHGFQTLQDDTEVAYQMSHGFSPAHYRGVRYDDPAFAICWPLPVTCVSDRDRGYPDFAR
jgi:dTDP-4-dehydrorhamnose 3,5-epimerase